MEKKNFPRPKFFHTLLRSAEIKKEKKYIYKKKTKKKRIFSNFASFSRGKDDRDTVRICNPNEQDVRLPRNL